MRRRKCDSHVTSSGFSLVNLALVLRFCLRLRAEYNLTGNKASARFRPANMSSTLQAKSAIHLPSPQERPEADVVIYDGNCRMCTAQVHKLAWWDCHGKLSYLSLHNPEAA